MSRKILGLWMMTLVLFACNQGKTTNSDTTELTTKEKENIIADSHDARNSLDITGTYKGVLPCADCEGIETEVTLKDDNTYRMKMTYKGKNNTGFEEKGTYSWDNNSNNVITLQSEENVDSYYKYKVEENALVQLDREGNNIESVHADLYILRK